MKKIFILFAVALLSVAVSDARKKEHEPFDLKKHEFTVSGALWPGQYALGYYHKCDCPYYYDNSFAHLYDKTKYYDKKFITNAWSLAYFYNFTKICSIGVSASYEGGWTNKYRRSDDSVVSKRESHYITPMAHVRISWLNRKYIRMYSELALGVTGRITDESEITFAGQGTFFGLSCGGKVFGIAEIGFGSVYVGGRMGIGYRF